MARYEADSIEGRIRAAGWFPGSERDWRVLDCGDREQLAFTATGCAVAYPTWEAPVDCVHTECLVLRGQLPKIALVNTALRAEKSNWLRDAVQTPEGRKRTADLFRATRKAARATGIYDAWKLAWQGIVGTGVGAWL